MEIVQQSSMLHESETWPLRKENEVALQHAEMRMVRCLCGIKLVPFTLRYFYSASSTLFLAMLRTQYDL